MHCRCGRLAQEVAAARLSVSHANLANRRRATKLHLLERNSNHRSPEKRHRGCLVLVNLGQFLSANLSARDDPCPWCSDRSSATRKPSVKTQNRAPLRRDLLTYLSHPGLTDLVQLRHAPKPITEPRGTHRIAKSSGRHAPFGFCGDRGHKGKWANGGWRLACVISTENANAWH